MARHPVHQHLAHPHLAHRHLVHPHREHLHREHPHRERNRVSDPHRAARPQNPVAQALLQVAERVGRSAAAVKRRAMQRAPAPKAAR